MARAASVPPLHYPAELPIVAAREEILGAIRDHQVVVIAGETGSGKTTQLPKMCLELGRGVTGMIGHTQPRRIAARAVAERLAEELHVPLGEQVGYQVRFADHTSPGSLVKVMTDGVLLAELQRDRQLRRYDTIIVDEAHERSLTIDFLLGYLKHLLPQRPDLKLLVTSATIDPQRFADHFATATAPVPVIEVSGRTYPVEIRYRPLTRTGPDGSAEVEVDQVTGVCEAVEELWTEGPGRSGADGGGHDILVFLSGEREIRDTAEAVRALRLPDTEVLPLYGRLSAAEQHRVFARHPGRRVVLATNVAETSLTVPGIRYVVDAGTARISRFSQRTKVQRLPIEPISQASARQRSGRCGRTADGVAIRLYSEADFETRPQYTDPEVLRTSLAAVILQMTALRLGAVERFPFIDPPDSRAVRDGVRLLAELGALDPHHRLTAIGRQLARIPLDPRLARMVVQAAEDGTLREVLVLVSALSIQDVRERPTDRQTQADQAHAVFRDERSDLVTLLNLWEHLRSQRQQRSGSAFRRMCLAQYLHYLRVREWQDLHSALSGVVKELRMTVNAEPAARDLVHQSVLAGLCSHVGWYDATRRDYLGARGARFAIQPGSTLARRPPEWVMAVELVETSRLWARTCAPIEPDWAVRAAGHLVKRQYSEPRWSARRGSAVATERVTLYGVPLIADRVVGYGPIDPQESRALFIRHALVEGDWRTPHRFFHDNRRLLERVQERQDRARRHDVLVDEQVLVDFYDRLLPADVVSAGHFDSWWKRARRDNPDLLTFTEELLVSEQAAAIDDADYPSRWQVGDLSLPLTYQFEPGSEADGVSVHVPVDVLNRIPAEAFQWQVPGLRLDLVTALIRSLPKATRRRLAPAPQHAGQALAELDPDAGPLLPELARTLYVSSGTTVDPDEFDWSKVPAHLRLTIVVIGADGARLAHGKDLADLRTQLQTSVTGAIRDAAAQLTRSGLTDWSFGALPPTFQVERDGRRLHGYPALVDHGRSVSLQVLPEPDEAQAVTALGLRRLVLLNTTVPWSRLLAAMTNQQKLALGTGPHSSVSALLEDCVAAAVDAIISDRPGEPVRTPEAFAEVLTEVRGQLIPVVLGLVTQVAQTLSTVAEVRLALERMRAPVTGPLRQDLAAHLDRLIHPGFVADTGPDHLDQLPRYVQAMLVRIDRAAGALDRDAALLQPVLRLEAEYAQVLSGMPAARRVAGPVRQIRWMLEELRVAVFAQVLGTAQPVSEKRVRRALEAVRRSPDGPG